MFIHLFRYACALNYDKQNLFPAWSPDGKKLVFVGQDGIYLINRDGSGKTKITNLKTTFWSGLVSYCITRVKEERYIAAKED